MNVKSSCLVLSAVAWLVIGAPPILAAPETSLQKTTTFALGGVGYAGVMSEGERTLREILKQSDAPKKLESVLPNASAAGQLYALLGLRLRNRAAYQRALEKYRAKDATVATMRGCIMQRESFRKLVEQIDQGDYDSFLERDGPSISASLETACPQAVGEKR
jgi:hypothetical protein